MLPKLAEGCGSGDEADNTGPYENIDVLEVICKEIADILNVPGSDIVKGHA